MSRRRLKRWVAPAQRLLAALRPRGRGARSSRAEVGERPDREGHGAPSFAGAANARTVRDVVELAWPIAAAMVGETAIGLVDTKLVGGLGPAALGGVGLGATFMFLSYAFVFGLSRGVKVRTAHAVGEGRPEEGLRYALAGVAISAAIGVLVWFACRDVTWLCRVLAVDPALHEPARLFLAARTYGAPATCVLSCLYQYRQALGDARTPMIVGIGGNAVNALLAYGLIYGHFGLPALGVEGAGYGTAVTEWLEVTVMIALVLREARGARLRRGDAAPVSFARAVREVTSLGVPTGFQWVAETVAFTAFTAILGGLGDTEIAAHQVAMAIIRVSFLPGVAVSEAASVLVGQALGQRDLDRADRVTRASLGVAIAFMAVCGLGFALFGGPLARAFTNDAGVAHVGERLLWVAALFQVLDAVNIVLRGALRGAKDVRAVAIIGTAVVWVCIPGAALLLGRLAGWGAVGGWWGFVAETTISAALFGIRWRRGAWRQDYAGSPAAASSSPTLVGAAAPAAG